MLQAAITETWKNWLRLRKLVDSGGENLNSLFDELAEFEAQLKPFTDDILAESAPQPVSAGGLKL